MIGKVVSTLMIHCNTPGCPLNPKLTTAGGRIHGGLAIAAAPPSQQHHLPLYLSLMMYPL